MTLLYDAIEDKKADVRNLEKNLTRGSLTNEELQKMMKQLPDDGVNAEWISIDSLQGDVD
jgi:hypothetical protein